MDLTVGKFPENVQLAFRYGFDSGNHECKMNSINIRNELIN